MSDDQDPFISHVPDHLKTKGLNVLVYDGKGNKVCEYYGRPGLRINEYAKGPGTYTLTESSGAGIAVKVFSEKTRKLIQLHLGVYV